MFRNVFGLGGRMRPGRHLVTGVIAGLVCVVPAVRAEPGSQDDSPPRPFSLRPYRVHVVVSVTGAAGGRPIDADAVRAGVHESLLRMYGRMWQVQVTAPAWRLPGTPEQIRHLTVDDLVRRLPSDDWEERFPEQDMDKVVFVAVTSQTAGYEIVCREFDTRMHDLSPVHAAVVPEDREIGPVAAGLVREVFRPVLRFVRRYSDDDDQEYFELQAQAGELPPPDPAAEQVRAGDILRPFLRRMKRRDPTRLRLLKRLPLTYIRVTDVDLDVIRGRTTGILLTHTPAAPFGLRGRGLQQLALRQRPVASSSRLRLVQRSREQKPLICQRVRVAWKLRSRDEDQRPQLPLLSDRNGEIEIPADPDFPTLWIYVYSGSRTLARVPYAPGLVPAETVLLPDDSIRLSVEGDLKLLQDELVDAVALREVQMSLARKALEENRPEDVRHHLDTYFRLPGQEHFQDALALIRVSAVRRAQASGNRFAQRDVEKLCDQMEETLSEFFSDQRRAQRMAEINELRVRAGLE